MIIKSIQSQGSEIISCLQLHMENKVNMDKRGKASCVCVADIIDLTLEYVMFL